VAADEAEEPAPGSETMPPRKEHTMGGKYIFEKEIEK